MQSLPSLSLPGLTGKGLAVIGSDGPGLMHAWKLGSQGSKQVFLNYTKHLTRGETRDLRSIPFTQSARDQLCKALRVFPHHTACWALPQI